MSIREPCLGRIGPESMLKRPMNRTEKGARAPAVLLRSTIGPGLLDPLVGDSYGAGTRVNRSPLPAAGDRVSRRKEVVMTWSRSSFWSLLALGTLILAPTFACQESPVEPRPNDRALAGAWCPTWAWWNCDVEPAAENNEEEVFGGVFMNDSPLTPSQAEGFEVVLNEVPGTGACIHHFDDGPGTCRVSQQMPVRTEGSVVGSANSNKHFGWYNNLDTGDNPCNPSRPDHTERHDTNLDGVADPGNEKHCVTPGSYKIRLVENGVTRFTREIDHVRNVGGVTADGGRTIENPNGDSATDVVVQFELASTVPVNLGVLKLDDGSDGVNSFVNGNLTVEETFRYISLVRHRPLGGMGSTASSCTE